ncbi:MAG: DNA-3-methyladenine glycosylase family protein [Acidimicrobiales bacterium]
MRSDLRRALAELAGADPVLAELVARYGPPRLARAGAARGADAHFAELVRSVVYQQLAGRAAAAIHGRLEEAVGGTVVPGALLELGLDGLRQVGLSGAKAATVAGLALAVSSGELDLGRIARLPDDEVVARLSALRGIGPWTAHMFCIFQLGRLDVWPVTDYGVRKGYWLAWELAELPSSRALEPLGERFRPWRSVVAWYCWRVAEDGSLPTR